MNRNYGRVLIKTWRNGKGGKWTIRIRYFEAADTNDVRLSMEDCECQRNYFPHNREHAEAIYQKFKTEAPAADRKVPQPFVAAFITSIQAEG